MQEQQDRFEQLIQGLTERRLHRIEVGLIQGLTERRLRRIEVWPESLKLTKLAEGDDIEAFLTTFERAVEAHGVDRDKRADILASQLTGKVHLAYAAIIDADAKNYD